MRIAFDVALLDDAARPGPHQHAACPVAVVDVAAADDRVGGPLDEDAGHGVAVHVAIEEEAGPLLAEANAGPAPAVDAAGAHGRRPAFEDLDAGLVIAVDVAVLDRAPRAAQAQAWPGRVADLA